MEVSSNWKKYLEVNGEKTMANIALSVLVLYSLYSLFKVHSRQVEEVAMDASNSENTCGAALQEKQIRHNRRLRRNLPKSISHPVEEEPVFTQAIALDCEMVGIQDGKESMLARVSLVNSHGQTLLDSFVKPTEPVVDYRTAVSGVRPKDLENGMEFHRVQKMVADMLRGRILVGHALRNDLRVLFLSHPRRNIRDTSKYGPFREFTHGRTPSLKKLANEILGVKLQQGEHSSVEDARAAMHLYNLYKKEWESGIN